MTSSLVGPIVNARRARILRTSSRAGWRGRAKRKRGRRVRVVRPLEGARYPEGCGHRLEVDLGGGSTFLKVVESSHDFGAPFGASLNKAATVRRRVIVSEASDDELVGLTARGDRMAFTWLVVRHRARLLALTTRTLRNRAAAEDIVQDVFIRAWTNAPTWQARESGRASYAAWLSRVAVNLAIDQTRKVRPVAIESIAEPQDSAVLPEAAMIARERADKIRAAIAALPERQRVALGLTYDAGLSNADGAAAMETSVGAFELLLVRARRALRLALSESDTHG